MISGIETAKPEELKNKNIDSSVWENDNARLTADLPGKTAFLLPLVTHHTDGCQCVRTFSAEQT